MPTWIESLARQADAAAGRALGEQDANPYSVTAGCFDRRYWAWKLVDFAEATYQRRVLPLAMLYRSPQSRFHGSPEVVAAVRAGLMCAAGLQHSNGSFDQAFPHEQSYGATAFLLYPLLEAARLVDDGLDAGERLRVEDAARRAADFLCAHDERHGFIANHLAGAALALAVAADRFKEPRFDAQSAMLLDRILSSQSSEGWFPEYDGADPGYQTLCLDYLSDLAERRPSARLDQALDRATEFLQWFVHPDGTFGGLYGSRRTSVVYPAGFVRLAVRNPIASAICDATGAALATRAVVGPADIDAGNLAPLLTSVVHSLDRLNSGTRLAPAALPRDTAGTACDFAGAGIHIRSRARYYAVCGSSNGGTLTIFARDTQRLLLDDGGYVTALGDGSLATTQSTDRSRAVRVEKAWIELKVPFVRMPQPVPTPARFLVLRLLNLTVMRSIAGGNWIKRRLAGLMMRPGSRVALGLIRRISFDDAGVRVEDRIENPGGIALRWLSGGRPFSAIHMASAGYFDPARLGTLVPPVMVDVQRLARERRIDVSRTI